MTISYQRFDFATRSLRKRVKKSVGDLTAPYWQALPVSLFQKLVRFATERLGNANQTGQRKIIFAAFDAADERPVHIGALGERFLRQGHFFSIRTHVLGQTPAILFIHAGQFWRKEGVQNIDVNTIVFNTSRWGLKCAMIAARFPNVTGNFWTGQAGVRQNFAGRNEFNESNCGGSERDGFQKAVRDQSFFFGYFFRFH